MYIYIYIFRVNLNVCAQVRAAHLRHLVVAEPHRLCISVYRYYIRIGG